MRDVDSTLPIFHLQPMDAYTAKSLAQRTLSVQLIVVFGAIAVVLAIVGVYGVVAYTVRLRTQEMGIRLAVGAQGSDILRLVLRDVLKTTLVGLSAGLGAAVWLGRFVESLLFEVKSNDAGTMAAVAALICGAAVLAGLMPARRAAGVELMNVLRVK
jgi:ABC-type antimicrobial peptide transport system permease subunit